MQIWAEGDLVLEVHPGLTDAFIGLQEPVVWGTDGIRYISHGLGPVVERLPDFRRVELRRGDDLLGGYGLALKQVRVGEHEIPVVHRFFLAVAPEHGGQGFGRRIVEQTRRHFLDEAAEPVLLYGYVEDDNARSMKVVGSGYTSLGAMVNTIVSRLAPSDHDTVRALRNDEIDAMRERLATAYADYALVDLDDSFLPGDYHVVEHDGRVVAGAQAEAHDWSIVSMSGMSGSLALFLIPKLPVLQRYLRNREFRHLRVGNVWVEPGHETAFFALVEALLARTGRHTALAFHHDRDPLFERIRDKAPLDVLDSLDASKAQILAGHKGLSDAVVAELAERPLFISMLDPM